MGWTFSLSIEASSSVYTAFSALSVSSIFVFSSRTKTIFYDYKTHAIETVTQIVFFTGILNRYADIPPRIFRMDAKTIEERLLLRTSVVSNAPVSAAQCLKQAIVFIHSKTSKESPGTAVESYNQFVRAVELFKLECEVAQRAKIVAESEAENYKNHTADLGIDKHVSKGLKFFTLPACRCANHCNPSRD